MDTYDSMGLVAKATKFHQRKDKISACFDSASGQCKLADAAEAMPRNNDANLNLVFSASSARRPGALSVLRPTKAGQVYITLWRLAAICYFYHFLVLIRTDCAVICIKPRIFASLQTSFHRAVLHRLSGPSSASSAQQAVTPSLIRCKRVSLHAMSSPQHKSIRGHLDNLHTA
jgi:hypothetical protein